MNSSTHPRIPRKRLLATAAIVLAAIPAAAAQAETRYAAPGGDGPVATCPQENPCDIQTAVEDVAVADGDEVIVAEGTDNIAGDPLTIDNAITVRGPAPGERPQITGGGPGRFEVVTPYGGTKLRDLDLRQFGGEFGLYAINGASRSTRAA